MDDQVITTQAASVYQSSWLDFDDEVEVIWTDAKGEPHRTVGHYQGVAVPDQGGPSSFVVIDDDDEVHIYLGDIAGMTRLG
jgi:hypothetical protein